VKSLLVGSLLFAMIGGSPWAIAQSDPSIELGASTSYAWSGEHDGFGGAL
jgi:hypothetical protein